jgi:hypothetical protein
VVLAQGPGEALGRSGAVLDEQDPGIEAGLGGGQRQGIADPEFARGERALAQLVGHRLEAHEAAHPAEQGGVVHGLGQEVVGPGVEAAQAVRGLVEGRDHHHRDMGRERVVLEVPADLEPVHAGHHHVEQDEVAEALLADRDRVPAIHGRERVEIFQAELRLQKPDVREQIIDDQDTGRHASS